MSSMNNTTTVNFELWFIVITISTIITLVLAILMALIFLIIVIYNKQCHTIPLMLISNSCIAEIFYGSTMLSSAVFRLQNDIKQRAFQDALCNFRNYLAFLGAALLLYSFTLQALYRYVIVIYPALISWQSVRVQGTLMSLSWIFCIISHLPWLLMDTATYNVDNQACTLPYKLSIPIIYNVTLIYLIPVSMIILLYFKLVRYVHKMNHHPTLSVQTLQQARRELVMIQRIIITISILLILGLPFIIFLLISFVTKPPKYYHRISVFFCDLSQALIMITLFKFSQPVMNVLLKIKRRLSTAAQSTNRESV